MDLPTLTMMSSQLTTTEMDQQRRVIDSFTAASGYGFLSNYHASTFYIDGEPYPDVEHAYQAHKTLDPVARDLIRRASSPGSARKLGRAVVLRPDWEEVKLRLMRDFVQKKFDNPLLLPMLLATGDAELVNGNTWNDTFFGVCRGKGHNWLGKILMSVREAAAVQAVVDR